MMKLLLSNWIGGHCASGLGPGLIVDDDDHRRCRHNPSTRLKASSCSRRAAHHTPIVSAKRWSTWPRAEPCSIQTLSDTNQGWCPGAYTVYRWRWYHDGQSPYSTKIDSQIVPLAHSAANAFEWRDWLSAFNKPRGGPWLLLHAE